MTNTLLRFRRATPVPASAVHVGDVLRVGRRSAVVLEDRSRTELCCRLRTTAGLLVLAPADLVARVSR